MNSIIQPTNAWIWLGITDADSEDTWYWPATKTEATYTRFHPTEPNGGTGENCAIIWQENGSWADLNCASTLNYNICERPIDKPAPKPVSQGKVFNRQRLSTNK